MNRLYRFSCYCGGMGDLDGIFVADDEREVAPAMERRIYFGEVLGKHSDVVLNKLKPEHLEVLEADADFCDKFVRYKLATGFNPLHYLTCGRCSDTLDAPYTACRHDRCGWKEGE